MGGVVRPLVAIASVEGAGVAATAVAALVSGLVAGDELGFVLGGVALYGIFAAGVLIVAAGLGRRRAWARGPFIVLQLFTLVVAWNLALPGSSPRWVGMVLALLAGAGLALGLRPATRAALQ